MRKFSYMMPFVFLFSSLSVFSADAKQTFYYRHNHTAGSTTSEPTGNLTLRINGNHPFTVGKNWTVTPTLTGKDADKFKYSMPTKPSWMSINENTGVITGTPPSEGDHGEAIVVATYTDQRAETSFHINVGSPIEIAKLDDILQFPDGTVERKIEVSGGDGDYTFGWDEVNGPEAPEWLELAEKDGTLSGIAEEGQWELVVEVTDKTGRKETTDVKIDVVKGSNWFTHINGGMQARQVSIGPNGGVFISGTVGNKPFMGRLDDEGVPDWMRTIETSGNGYGMDATNGSIYLSGTTNDGGMGQSILVSKFTQYGNREWIRAVGTSGSQKGASVAASGDGSVVVVGTNFSISKLSASGNLLWSKNFEWRGYEADAVAISGSGDIYVAGSAFNLFGSSSGDIVLVKLTSSGELIWARSFGSSTNEYIRAITVGQDQSVYLAGAIEEPGNNKFLVAKYSSNGNPQWFKKIGVPNSQDILHGITTAGDGTIYVSGQSNIGQYGDNEAAYIQLSSAGDIIRARTFGNNASDIAYGIAANARGSVYLSGVSVLPNTSTDRALVTRFSGALPSNDVPLPIDVLYKNAPYQISNLSLDTGELDWETRDLPWSAVAIDNLQIGNTIPVYEDYSFD